MSHLCAVPCAGSAPGKSVLKEDGKVSDSCHCRAADEAGGKTYRI